MLTSTAPQIPSMHAQGFQIVLPRRGECEIAFGRDTDAGAVGRADRPYRLAIDLDLANVRDVLHAPHREIASGHPAVDAKDHFGPVVHGVSPFFATGASTSIVCFDFEASFVPIGMVRARVSGIGRRRSICNSPLSRLALVTSIPSARTKARWNWRAAMPR